MTGNKQNRPSLGRTEGDLECKAPRRVFPELQVIEEFSQVPCGEAVENWCEVMILRYLED